MTISIRYHAHDDVTGYGKAAAGYIEALDRAGAKVEVVPVASTGWEGYVDVAIYHTTPARLDGIVKSRAGRHVALTTWETDRCPMEHLWTLDGFDAVITPSEFCASLFIKLVRGLESDKDGRIVRVVPHGFDPSVWVPKERPKNDVFTFYSIGTWGERKNTLGLLKAYLHAFRKSDRVRLVLVVDKCNFTAIHSLLARSGIAQEDLPGLVIPSQRLTDEEIVSLHNDGDCFVTATRAEGFGLPIFEAAVMGKPIIAPGFGGQVEFLEAGTWREIPYSLTPVFPGEDEVTVEGNLIKVATTVARGSNCTQMWAEPNLDKLAQAMQSTVNARRMGFWDDSGFKRTRPWLEENYSFKAIGKKFLNILKEI